MYVCRELNNYIYDVQSYTNYCICKIATLLRHSKYCFQLQDHLKPPTHEDAY